MENSTLSAKYQPKRIILKLRVKDFTGRDYHEYTEAITAYLKFAGLEDKDQVFSHIEPFQAPELQRTSFHIILDLYKDSLPNPDLKSLQHEIYRIHRDEQGNFQVMPFKNQLEAKSYICKARVLTDISYRWGV